MMNLGRGAHYLIGIVLLALALGVGSPPALAHDVAVAEMQPLEDELAELRLVEAEIERRGRQRVAQLQKWVEWWSRVKEFFSETATRLARDFDERIANARKAQATLGGLSESAPPAKRNLPSFGWHDRVSIANLASNLEQERARSTKLVEELKANWWIAGAGWVTGEVIQRTIDDTQKQIRAIQQGVREGAFEVNLSGYGWTRGSAIRESIAGLEQRQKTMRAQIVSGDYPVTIPGLGVRTRKQLEAELAGVKAELESRRAKVAKEELSIHRPAFDWKTRKQLQEELDAGAKAFEAMKKTVSDGLYEAWLVETGWARRVDLEGRVKALDENLAKAQAALAKGEYRAQLPVGWATANELNRALERLGKELGEPKLQAKARQELEKQLETHRRSLAELQALSAFDLAIMALEKARVARFVTAFLSLARPDFERRELVRAEKSEGLDEYATDARFWLQSLEHRLARLEAARAWLPGGR